MVKLLLRRLIVCSALTTMLSGACAFPQVEVRAPADLAIVAGTRGTALVSTAPVAIDDCVECVDLSGLTFDFVVQGLPVGITYTVDQSLQSPSTPGLVRIHFDVDAHVAPGYREPVIHALVSGRSVGMRVLRLRVLPTLWSGAAIGAHAMSAGGQHSLVALADGTVRSWGANFESQLGVDDVLFRDSPGFVPGLFNIDSVVAGSGESFAVTRSGEVWAWGDNRHGQLGIGVRSDTPGGWDPIRVPSLADVRTVAADGAIALALKRDGSVWEWGDRAGNVPVRVQGLPEVRSVAAGHPHTPYALAVGVDGTVWIWGQDTLPLENADATDTPVQVAGLQNIRSVATRGGVVLALDADGHVWVWGGEPFYPFFHYLTPTRVAGLDDITAIAVGDGYAIALDADGAVWELGTEGRVNDDGVASPARVPGLAGIREIAAGDSHSLARDTCGQIWAWGSSLFGRLGVADVGDPRQPRPVLGIGDACGSTTTLRVSVAGAGGPREDAVVSSVAELQYTRPDHVAVVPLGTVVDLTAVAAIDDAGSRFVFDGWAGDCAALEPATSVPLDRSRHCTAKYRDVTPSPSLLSVRHDGHGRVVSTSGGILGPSSIECGQVCEAVIPHGLSVTLTATADAGFTFTGWSSDCAGNALQTQVVMDATRTCRAGFRPYTLDIAVSGSGIVRSAAPVFECDSTCRFAPEAATVTLTAEPVAGWLFTGWGGNCSGTAMQVSVAMNADRNCSATFSRDAGLVSLTLVTQGQGTVLSQPAGIACPGTCVAFFPVGTTVDLTATPAAGWMISFWLEDCASPGTPTHSIVMDADRQCRIHFDGQPRVPVASFTVSPPIPRFVGDVVTFDASASHVFDPVTGTQDPADVRSFSWDLDGDGVFEISGGRATAAIVQTTFQTTGNHLVRLRVRGGPFDLTDEIERQVLISPPPTGPFTLTVVVNKPAGSIGSVESVPPAILCHDASGPSCTASFASGTTVVVRPSDTSLELGLFSGWSGCDSVGPLFACSVTMTNDRTVTATFAR